MVHIFVYGTLLFDEVVLALTGKVFESEPAMLNGFTMHKIADPNNSGKFLDYPAIKTALGNVSGKVLFDVDDKSMEIIDFYEDDLHSKVTFSVNTSQGPVNALVYVWNSSEDILTQEWDPDWFKEHKLNDYLEKKIPAVLEKYKCSTRA